MATCKNCWICKKEYCSIYNSIDTNSDGDDWYNHGKTSFGNSNNTRRNGGQRPSNSPKGFFD